MRARFGALFLGGTLAFGQSTNPRIPGERAPADASASVRGYALSKDSRTVLDASGNVLLYLPAFRHTAASHLCGMLDQPVATEILLCWRDPAMKPEGFEHHVAVFQGQHKGEATLVHDFTFVGGPEAKVNFFKPAGAVLVDVQGGSYWGTTYAISADRRSATELFRSSDYAFADLDRDGTFELIAWNRRPFDMRCRFGIFAVRFYPEVFAGTGGEYWKIWPPADWLSYNGTSSTQSLFQVTGTFADLNRDGKTELVVLQDRSGSDPRQSVAVYALAHGFFHLLTQETLPRQRIAFLMSRIADRSGATRISVRTASPARCEAGGDPNGPGTAAMSYSWSAGRLRRTQ